MSGILASHIWDRCTSGKHNFLQFSEDALNVKQTNWIQWLAALDKWSSLHVFQGAREYSNDCFFASVEHKNSAEKLRKIFFFSTHSGAKVEVIFLRITAATESRTTRRERWERWGKSKQKSLSVFIILTPLQVYISIYSFSSEKRNYYRLSRDSEVHWHPSDSEEYFFLCVGSRFAYKWLSSHPTQFCCTQNVLRPQRQQHKQIYADNALSFRFIYSKCKSNVSATRK